MTEQQFKTTRALYVDRLHNAIKNRCFRVALARVRDLSRLYYVYQAVPYQETYKRLLSSYNLSDKSV